MDDYTIIGRGSSGGVRPHRSAYLPEPATLVAPRQVAREAPEAKRNADEDEEDDLNDDYHYDPRLGAVRQRAERERELKQLYNKIARKFPFVVEQGLKKSQRTPSLNDIFSLPLFGQPRRGKKK